MLHLLPVLLLPLLLQPWGLGGAGAERTDTYSAPGAIERSCQPIQVDMCKGLMYNSTGMPNFIGHDTQQEAQLSIQTYSPLVTFGCSRKLKFFLCSVHTPMCSPVWRHPIGPCRPLCEDVRERCLPVLKEFGFSWPPHLNCSKFPVKNNDQAMCMEGPQLEERLAVRGQCGHLRNAKKYVYVNRTKRCALKCAEHDLFSAEDKHIAEVWMGVLSGLCFVSTLFTVLTFLIDSQRFKYPERPIVFLAMCYNIYSISYFVRLVGGREAISCDRMPGDPAHRSILIQEGLDNTDCAISFLLHYYFHMASGAWWVVLTFSWLLAAGLKWGHEAIQRHSCWYHFIAWLLPALLTVVVLVMRDVDADELLGVCSVGNQKESTLLAFLVVPNIMLLILGSLFLLGGFVALMKIRRHVKNGGIKTDRLELLMVRIGVFSVLYVVPATCVLACQLYELTNRKRWHARQKWTQPSVEVFMLRVFMCLVVGITNGVWIWSAKTIRSWRNFLRRGPPTKMGPGMDKGQAGRQAVGGEVGANGAAALLATPVAAGAPGAVPVAHARGGPLMSSGHFESYPLPPPGASSAPAQTPRLYRTDVKYSKGALHAETVI